MSQDVPIPRQGNRSADAAVLEWGPTDAAPEGFTRTVAGLHRDPRFPVVLAGLGGVAALASLMGEWLVMTVPGNGPEGSGTLHVPNGVAEVGNFGVGYLVGLLGLTGAAALALGGTRDVRRNARVFGLGVAVALLAILVAATVSLDDATRRSLFYPADSGFQVEYGRGLAMAFVGVLLLGAALRLSGSADRRAEPPSEDVTASAGHPPAEDDDPTAPARTTSRPGPAGTGGRSWWPGRRTRTSGEEQPSAPEGLTVEPATPFARPSDGPPGGR